LKIYKEVAEIPGVARDSIQNEGTRQIRYIRPRNNRLTWKRCCLSRPYLIYAYKEDQNQQLVSRCEQLSTEAVSCFSNSLPVLLKLFPRVLGCLATEKHVPAATDTHAITDELGNVSLSVIRF
jgi:hypothetical protein